jgi:hypothetical protein
MRIQSRSNNDYSRRKVMSISTIIKLVGGPADGHAYKVPLNCVTVAFLTDDGDAVYRINESRDVATYVGA